MAHAVRISRRAWQERGGNAYPHSLPPLPYPRRLLDDEVRIQVTKHAWDRIGRLTEKYGMTQVALHSRMVEWLCAQPDQSWVI